MIEFSAMVQRLASVPLLHSTNTQAETSLADITKITAKPVPGKIAFLVKRFKITSFLSCCLFADRVFGLSGERRE